MDMGINGNMMNQSIDSFGYDYYRKNIQHYCRVV